MTARAVVFDFGGVLFRWRPAVLLAHCLPQRVVDAASAAHWVAQVFQGYTGDWLAFDLGDVTVPQLAQRIAARTGLLESEVHAIVDAVPDELQPVPETVALLQRLHAAGTPLYYLSNMPAPYADHLERTYGFMACFQGGVYSSRVRLAKPERAIFDLACAQFGRAPEELVFLDDHPSNVAAAQAARWHSLVYTEARHAAAALRRWGFDAG